MRHQSCPHHSIAVNSTTCLNLSHCTTLAVTGTPGIGKSWFFYYILARLLKSTQPPPFIVWEHMTVPNMAVRPMLVCVFCNPSKRLSKV